MPDMRTFARRCNCLLRSNVETCRKSDVVVRGVFQAFLSSWRHSHGSLALMIGNGPCFVCFFYYVTALMHQAIPLLHGRSDGQLCSGFVFNEGSLVWLSDVVDLPAGMLARAL